MSLRPIQQVDPVRDVDTGAITYLITQPCSICFKPIRIEITTFPSHEWQIDVACAEHSSTRANLGD